MDVLDKIIGAVVVLAVIGSTAGIVAGWLTNLSAQSFFLASTIGLLASLLFGMFIYKTVKKAFSHGGR